MGESFSKGFRAAGDMGGIRSYYKEQRRRQSQGRPKFAVETRNATRKDNVQPTTMGGTMLTNQDSTTNTLG